MKDVIVSGGKLAGKGVYANRNFRKGEIVIRYNLKPLTREEYKNLPDSQKIFVHSHLGQLYLYSSPERYVNHSRNPNTNPNLEDKCDVAIRGIKKGEEITTDSKKDDTP